MSEMPITRFDLVGDWGKDSPKRGYNNKDIGILTNSKAVDKIHKRWSNTEYEFDFYFLRAKNAWKNREVGEVTKEFVKNEFGLDIEPEENRITVIFTNNIGAEKIPMNAWMIAHRLSHSLRSIFLFQQYLTDEITRDFNEIIKDIRANITLLDLAYILGTTKSCRERNLLNFTEFIHELFAQYIITGDIKFNKLQKKQIKNKKYAWGKPNFTYLHLNLTDQDLAEINQMIEYHADKYKYNISSVLGTCLNKIFVM